MSPDFRFWNRSCRLCAGEDPKEQLKGIAKYLLVPVVAITVFLSAWSLAARHVVTDSMRLPSPLDTWNAGKQLFAMHSAQKTEPIAPKSRRS